MIVVKLGGGLLPHAGLLDRTLAVMAERAREGPLLVVPGGGPFADAVRTVDRARRLPTDAAHWMAVLAIDQYAHLVAGSLPDAVLVAAGASAVRGDIAAAQASGRVPVLAPSTWLREVDPLPHGWEVTSDSIAAWVAGELNASRLILVKPPGTRSSPAGDSGLVDAHFSRALPPDLPALVVPADRVELLQAALQAAHGSPGGGRGNGRAARPPRSRQPG